MPRVNDNRLLDLNANFLDNYSNLTVAVPTIAEPPATGGDDFDFSESSAPQLRVAAVASYSLAASDAALAAASAPVALNGTVNDDVLTGTVADEMLRGFAGNDTYVVGANEGNDIISDYDAVTAQGGGLDVLQFKSGLTRANVIFALINGGVDLQISYQGQAGSLVISGYNSDNALAGIEMISFANGDFLLRDDVLRLAQRPTVGNDSLVGNSGNNRLEGLAGNDTLSGFGGRDWLVGGAGNDSLLGGNGSDIYEFGRGDGSDQIDERGSQGSGDDIIIFASGITVADVAFRKSSDGHSLILSLKDGSTIITIIDCFIAPDAVIEKFQFFDGSALSFSDVREQIEAYVNRAPIVANAILPVSVDEDQPIDFTIPATSFSDPDGDALTYTANMKDGSPTPTWLSFSNGRFTGTPPANYNGTLMLLVRASDGTDSVASNFNLVINAINDAPTAEDLLLDVVTTMPASAQLMARDVDGDSLSYTVKTAPARGSVSINSATGALIYTAKSGFLGADSFKIAVTDSAGATTLANVSVMVRPTVITGTAGADVLIGYNHAETLNGLAGNDILRGLGGADRLDGGAGIDTASYISSTAAVNVNLLLGTGTGGEAQGDTLFSIENLVGSSLNDILVGNALANNLNGGDGNDQLDGGAGNDSLEGGDGDDTYTWARGDGSDTITESHQNGTADTLVLTGINAVDIKSVGRSGGNVLLTIRESAAGAANGGVITIVNGFDEYYSRGIDLIKFADGSSWTRADLRTRYLTGAVTTGADTITGFNTNDRIRGGAGNDSLSGADGDDIFEFSGTAEGFDAIDGGAGADSITALANNSIIGLRSLTNIEAITAGSFTGVKISGSAAADTLNFTGVTLTGITQIEGGAGNDVITGTTAADKFVGGAGNDSLNGGTGADIAVFAGTKASYVITTTVGNFSVRDNAINTNGDDGTDTLVSIETLQFKDGTQNIVSPVILDLDGNGVQLIHQDKSKVRFDFDGDGIADQTGWFGKGDGILLYDRDGNGTLSNAAELSFVDDNSPVARSDLEGLLAFDSNKDGQFSSGDEKYAKFLVWRDANGNGSVDKREILTLAQAGVASINLSATPTARDWSVGDNIIINTGTFTRTNGSAGNFADVALAYKGSATSVQSFIEKNPKIRFEFEDFAYSNSDRTFLGHNVRSLRTRYFVEPEDMYAAIEGSAAPKTSAIVAIAPELPISATHALSLDSLVQAMASFDTTGGGYDSWAKRSEVVAIAVPVLASSFG